MRERRQVRNLEDFDNFVRKADLSDCLISAFHLPPGIEPVGIYKMSKKPDEAGEETPDILRYITKTIGKAFGEPGSTGQALIPRA